MKSKKPQTERELGGNQGGGGVRGSGSNPGGEPGCVHCGGCFWTRNLAGCLGPWGAGAGREGTPLECLSQAGGSWENNAFFY